MGKKKLQSKLNNPEIVKTEGLPDLLQWFEEHYTPGENGENGKPRAVNLEMNGIKGKILIMMMYEYDAKRI